MGFINKAMRLIPVFLILLFFTGVLLIVYMTWTTLSRRSESSQSLFGNPNGIDEMDADDIPYNGRKVNPQTKGQGSGGEEPWPESIHSVDEVLLYGEDMLKEAERIKMKVIPNLRRHVLNGAKVVGHLNHYGVNFSQLRPKSKVNRDRMRCQIKKISFDLLNPSSGVNFKNRKFPTEPLFSDIKVMGGNLLMEKEIPVPDDVNVGFGGIGGDNLDEPLYRTCAIIPNSGALDGSGHGLDIDSHDFILRFNNAPTKGFEEDVGTLTSMRILNSQVFTKYEFQFPGLAYYSHISNTQDAQNVTVADTSGLSTSDKIELDSLWSETKKYLIWDPCNFTSTVDMWYKAPDHPLFDKYFQLIDSPKKFGRNRYYILNCRVLWELWKVMHEYTFAKIYGNPPTSGFIGAILALQKCDRVNFYEYIPSIRETTRCHYYGLRNESNPACTYGSWHPVSAEKLFLLALSDSSDKQIFLDGMLSIPGVSKVRC